MTCLIRSIWTRSGFYIQQDGAKRNISEDDKEFNNALAEQDINVELYTQAANSPDVNLLNLGFFGHSKFQ